MCSNSLYMNCVLCQWPHLVHNCNQSFNICENSMHQKITASHWGFSLSYPGGKFYRLANEKNFCSLNPKLQLNLTIADKNIVPVKQKFNYFFFFKHDVHVHFFKNKICSLLPCILSRNMSKPTKAAVKNKQ